MDVAGALLPFTQVVRPELTVHVQEVLTQADRPADNKLRIPEINEPDKNEDEPNTPRDYRVHSPKREVNKRECVNNGGERNAAWWMLVVLPHGKKHVHFEAADQVYYFWGEVCVQVWLMLICLCFLGRARVYVSLCLDVL